MTGMAIVAIPESDNPVWKVSSEKIPHLTILYLGENVPNEQAADIAEFVQHAARNSLKPFGMLRTSRGILGDEGADVLFFDKEFATDIFEFRSYLLAHKDIRQAYDSTEQFPSWTPHLTLGYPEKPAGEVDDPGRLTFVMFDKIALWVGDFDGPTFDLTETRMEVSMSSDISPEKSIKHYGVKGMRWGVRKDRDGSPTDVQVAQKRPGTRLQTSGGKNQPASEDAKKVAISKQKAKASSLDSLSTKELQEVVNRLNLEQNYARLTTPQKSAGRKFLEKLWTDPNYRRQQSKNLRNNAMVQTVGNAMDVGNTITRTDLSKIGK